MIDACANCGQSLCGEYCHDCGQRRLRDGDRRLGRLLRQAVAQLADVDGRFLGSLRALAFQPGRLSRDWLDGRRRRWMSPVSLFLLANVLYFLAPALTDFNLPLRSQLVQPHSALTRPWVVERVAERDAGLQRRREALADLPARESLPARYTLQDYALAYDAQSGNVGKALIAVHVPFLALGLMLAFRRHRLYFAEHLVVATHLFTFVLLYIQLVLLPVGLAVNWARGGGPGPGWAIGAMMLPAFAYLGLSLRRVYGASWPTALLLPVVLNLVLIGANLLVYRFLQFAVTFALT